MNVDEAMAKWKRIRESYGWPKDCLPLVEPIIAEVERLRAELAAAKAASACPVEWKSAERFFKSRAALGNQWGVEFWFENKERRERFCEWIKERGEQ